MALFSRKPKTDAPAPQKPVVPAPLVQPHATSGKHASKILISPRVTEKGAYIGERGVYLFNVEKGANKQEIAQAIRTIYKVTPRKVRVVAIPRKQVATRGTNRMGQTAGGKKAYVYLKPGDTIEII